MIIQGIIFPGASETETDVHFLKLTPYGREALAANPPSPYDPDGYLATLRREIPAIDSVVMVYATEALQTFLRGNLLASTVMLGCASEKCILLLIDQYIFAAPQNQRANLQRILDPKRSIVRKFIDLRTRLNLIRPQLESNVADDLDIQLQGIFNLLRTARKDAGHPTGASIDRNRAFANLQLFFPYCELIYRLIGYFQTHTI